MGSDVFVENREIRSPSRRRRGAQFITSSHHRPIMRKMPADSRPIQAIRVDRHYPIALPLRYSAQRRKTPYAQGTGQTLAIGSASVLFVAGEPLVAGTSVELTLDWPARLAGQVPLQLRIKGKIYQIEEQLALMHIAGYEFRTVARSSPAPASVRQFFEKTKVPPLLRPPTTPDQVGEHLRRSVHRRLRELGPCPPNHDSNRRDPGRSPRPRA